LAQEAIDLPLQVIEECCNSVCGGQILQSANQEKPWPCLRYSKVSGLDDSACYVILATESLFQCCRKILGRAMTRRLELRLKPSDVFHKNQARAEYIDNIQIGLEQLVARIVWLAPTGMRKALARRSTRQQINLASQGSQCPLPFRQ